MIKKLLSATSLTLAMLCGAAIAPAQAAPILGSSIESQVFLDALAPNTAGWTYLGSDLGETSPFGTGGQLTVKLRSSSYLNTFGTSDMDHTNRTEIVSASAGVGSIYDLAASPVDRLFYFGANGTDLLLASDDNRQYTDGFSSGGTPGRFQGGIDILYHADSKTWAFFFDDAGGGIPILGDDNDYDDLVVTFRQYGVPEPGAVSLLGLVLLGFASMMRRRVKTCPAKICPAKI